MGIASCHRKTLSQANKAPLVAISHEYRNSPSVKRRINKIRAVMSNIETVIRINMVLVWEAKELFDFSVRSMAENFWHSMVILSGLQTSLNVVQSMPCVLS